MLMAHQSVHALASREGAELWRTAAARLYHRRGLEVKKKVRWMEGWGCTKRKHHFVDIDRCAAQSIECKNKIEIKERGFFFSKSSSAPFRGLRLFKNNQQIANGCATAGPTLQAASEQYAIVCRLDVLRRSPPQSTCSFWFLSLSPQTTGNSFPKSHRDILLIYHHSFHVF